MTDYPFDAIVAIDRITGERVVNGTGQVFALGDVARTTPLPVFDLTMLPLPDNKLTTNSEAYIPNFKVQNHWRVVFVSGTNEVIITSHEGLKEAADAAAAAAELSATESAASRTAAETAGETAATQAVDAVQTEFQERVASGEFKGDPGQDGSNVIPVQDALINELTNPTSPVAQALEQQVLGYANPAVIEDPDDPGFYLIADPDRVSEDPDHPGLYLIGA